ncbi:hypothetical protein [Streptomyces griseoflavus]|uniref:NUDIX hydrolase n=1 Tax=Streptomyces griseoflavus Tu4000 TaxID=467200 RepID=D9XPC7_9ACTN|nr:hypothetical protein SSRG_06243 [Streptomyces griseoflavus Tu4000]
MLLGEQGILLSRHRHGTFELPGGSVEAGKSFEDAFGAQEQHDALGRVEARMHGYCLNRLNWATGGQVPLPLQHMVSAVAARRLPQAEGYRLTLLRLP